MARSLGSSGVCLNLQAVEQGAQEAQFGGFQKAVSLRGEQRSGHFGVPEHGHQHAALGCLIQQPLAEGLVLVRKTPAQGSGGIQYEGAHLLRPSSRNRRQVSAPIG